ncbi:DUF4282 domain-containing protein [Phenylobacterium sp.]|jgi:hypothetical protein|uniref:DUF4282 domain-containing protein n=1 Tax=Phenylobacterium sp. TaxID=1871053 RepID=UPI002F93F046
MRRPLSRPQGPGAAVLWDLLTFEKLMTNTVVHLVYWAGLGIVAIVGMGVVGATIGVAIREGSLVGILLAIPVLVGGLLGIAAVVLLWRSFMEFYVAIFKISEDLNFLRKEAEAERARMERPRA